MTWVRIDDKSPHHPKMLRAGAEACWLWQAGLCYSNAHRLNGRIPKDLLVALYPPLASKTKSLAAKLVDVGLGHDCEDHYEIHDYHDFQEQALKESVQARRDYERERKRGQRKKDVPDIVPQFVPDIVPDIVPQFVPDIVPDNGGTLSAPVPSVTGAFPSRPVPSRPDPLQILIPSLRSGISERAHEDLPPFPFPAVAEPAKPPEPEPYAAPPGESPMDRAERLVSIVRRGFGRRFEAAEKSLWTQGNSPAVSTLAAWLSSVQGDPAEVLKRTLDAFFADPYCSTQHFPIAHLARYPQKYFEPRQTPGPGLRRTSKQARAEAQAAVIARDDAAVKRLVAEAKDLEDAEERAARGYRARA